MDERSLEVGKRVALWLEGMRRNMTRRLILWVGLSACVGLVSLAAVPRAEAAMRGLIDFGLENESAAEQDKILHETSVRLGAKATRVLVKWPLAEPQQGQYDEAYLTKIENAVITARKYKLRVLITVYQTPKWASNQAFWDNPPASSIPKGYQPYYAPKPAALDDFEAFAKMLASRLGGRVTWYECWNEPNLWTYLYPQQYKGDRYFGARTYVKMLRSFYKGIKAGYGKAMVLGGVTGPWGKNDKYTTSPKRFANRMKYHRAWRWWDAYSHHPYPVGGIPPAPGQQPRFPKYTISLGNARWLLIKFPKTQFYFTEYGYTTGDTIYFGGGGVSRKKQASYLRQAYRIADKLPRVRLLMWYERMDVRPGSGQPAKYGLYFGLRTADGNRKPSWYAFRQMAGGPRRIQYTTTSPSPSPSPTPSPTPTPVVDTLEPGDFFTLATRNFRIDRGDAALYRYQVLYGPPEGETADGVTADVMLKVRDTDGHSRLTYPFSDVPVNTTQTYQRRCWLAPGTYYYYVYAILDDGTTQQEVGKGRMIVR